jgi:hypothetical protein
MANVCLNPDNEIRSDEDWKKKSPKYYIISGCFINLILKLDFKSKS